MAALQDPEFGAITLRRSKLARTVRLKLDARGVISISLPMRTPLFIAKQLLNDSRQNLRHLVADLRQKRQEFKEGDMVGKSHVLRFETSQTGSYQHRIEQNQLIISRPLRTESSELQAIIHTGISKALRLQAKAYLPRRLQQLAETYGFAYQKIRFGSAGTRWGSCSSQGTISLNIWLMQLPFELIDYVLIHELCHTKEMNHSQAFWRLIETYCPNYRQQRKALKQFQPSL